MDRKFRIRVNILISVIILIGFVAVAITSYTTYSKIIKDDIVNITKLTGTNIYSDIRNELTKPIFVSLTMANDSFLKNWLKQEADQNTQEHQEALQQYLLGIRQKYGYDSVFLVSEESKVYYHYNGINKVVREGDAHDQWYYAFLDSGLSYDLDVDTDQANHDHLSVFVNCRITDEYGNLLGVTGVGVEIYQVQDLLLAFEEDFQLEAMLFSPDGMVQIHADEDFRESKRIFDIPVRAINKDKITTNFDSIEVIESAEEPFEGYFITRYIEDLNWFLLVKKDTAILKESLYAHIISDFIVYVIVVLFVLIIVNSIIRRNERKLINMTNTDWLTSLQNRRGFNKRLDAIIKETDNPQSLYVFVFDIDNFKNVNDAYGHLGGDIVLKAIGLAASDIFSGRGMVCRWGGDEFAGYLVGDKAEVIADIEKLFKRIREDEGFKQYGTTISLGLSRAQQNDTAETLIYRADTALYEAKGRGKNQYRILDGAEK